MPEVLSRLTVPIEPAADHDVVRKKDLVLIVPDQSILTRHIRDAAVTTPKLADNAVTTEKVRDGAITDAKIGNRSVGPASADSAMFGTTATNTQYGAALTKIANNLTYLKNSVIDVQSNELPHVLRIRIPAPEPGMQQKETRISIELDRPCPANCYVQLWRYSRRTGNHRVTINGPKRRKVRKAFRPIWIFDSNWVFYHGNEKIPINETTVKLHCGYGDLYRPRQIRPISVRFKPDNLFINFGTQRNDGKPNKTYYKIGVVQVDANSPMKIAKYGAPSAETLVIQRFYHLVGKTWDSDGQQYDLIATVY